MPSYRIIYQKRKRGKHHEHDLQQPGHISAWKYAKAEYGDLVVRIILLGVNQEVPEPDQCPDPECDYLGYETDLEKHIEREHPLEDGSEKDPEPSKSEEES